MHKIFIYSLITVFKFDINFTGIADICCKVVRGKSSCHDEGGCLEQQQPCLLHLVKENWELIGIPLKSDNNIIRLMKDVKAKFDKARANKRRSAAEKCEVVTGLKESTMNLAAADWRLKVNKDYSLNGAWRQDQEKVAFVEDYIGKEATR